MTTTHFGQIKRKSPAFLHDVLSARAIVMRQCDVAVVQTRPLGGEFYSP